MPERLRNSRHQNQVKLMAPAGHIATHSFEDGSNLWFQHVRRNARKGARFTEYASIGVSGQRDTGQGDLETGDVLNGANEGINVHPVAASQQRAVDVEQV